MDELHSVKLLRLDGALEAVHDEIRDLSVDETGASRLAATVRRLLVEVGSTLPDGLLQELSRMVGPLPAEPLSLDEARILLAQLQGWVDGLLAAVRLEDTDG